MNDYLFRILPVLKPGVVVHIHDIPYPFEYPYQWVLEENRSWNEAYLVRAFLQYNSLFEITYFNHYAFRKFGAHIEHRMPLIATNCGFSLWLQRSPA